MYWPCLHSTVLQSCLSSECLLLVAWHVNNRDSHSGSVQVIGGNAFVAHCCPPCSAPAAIHLINTIQNRKTSAHISKTVGASTGLQNPLAVNLGHLADNQIRSLMHNRQHIRGIDMLFRPQNILYGLQGLLLTGECLFKHEVVLDKI